MRLPEWIKVRTQGKRWRNGRAEVVFEFTIDDQKFTDAMRVAEAETRALDWPARVLHERAIGLAYVEGLTDKLGTSLGLDPRVWQAERPDNRRDRMRAERRAWMLARQSPSHPEFLGRRA